MPSSTGGDLPPLLVVAGMPRAATTTLFHNLGSHPELFAPARKETNYFSVNHGQGADWYARHFRGLLPGQRGVDASALYFLDPESVPRIVSYPADVRLLLSIRDPADFAVSLHRHASDRFDDVPELGQFLDGYVWRAGEGGVRLSLTGGSIVATIDRLCAAFGDRLLMFRFEHFRADALAVLQAVEGFAGLDAYYTEATVDDRVTNASGRKLPGPVEAVFRNERLVSLANRVVPRRLLQRARGALDRVGTGAGPDDDAARDRRLAAEVFTEDRQVLEARFAAGSILLGSGRPWPTASPDEG